MTLSSTFRGVDPAPKCFPSAIGRLPRVGIAAVDFGSLGSTIWCPPPLAGARREGMKDICLVHPVENGMGAMTKREAAA
jgi:hypothetical protein